MIAEQRWREQGVVLSIAGILAVAVIGLGGLALGKSDGVPGRDPGFARRLDDRALSARLAAVDEATARRDVRRASQAWRDAYPAALASRRWEAMVAMGDAAARIDGIAAHHEDHPAGFKPEARRAYLKALFEARSAGSTEGIQRAADGFTTLGDIEMASRARALMAAR